MSVAVKKNNKSKNIAGRSQRSVKPPQNPPRVRKLPLYRGPPRHLVETVCSLVDPFCPHALGAKYPSDSNVRTLSFTQRGRTPLTSSAAGYGNWMFIPQYGFEPFVSGLTTTGNNVAVWNNFYATALLEDVTSYRIVSAGFTVKRVSAPLTTSGMLHLRTFAALNGASLGSIDTTTFNASAIMCVPLQDAINVAAISPHTTQPPQTMYPVLTDAEVVAWQAAGYGPITVAVLGAPASTVVLEAEYFINYELMFHDGSGMSMVATASAPADPVIIGGANKVTSTLKSFVKEGTMAFGKTVINAAVEAIAMRLSGGLARPRAIMNVD